MHQVDDIIALFNGCFELTHNTRLVLGTDEPIYLPADEQCAYHRVIFAHGFFSSALHECAHWLIAGEARRQVIDYGYWYVPDGRTAEQQVLFEQVEVKPQAIEWILSKAAGYRFQFSSDNLTGEVTDQEAFKHAVKQQVLQYETYGLPDRAASLHEAITRFYLNC